MKYILSLQWLGKERYIQRIGTPSKDQIFTTRRYKALVFDTKERAEIAITEIKNKVIDELPTANCQAFLQRFIKTEIVLVPINEILFQFRKSKNSGLLSTKMKLKVSGTDTIQQATCSFCGLVIPTGLHFLQFGKSGALKSCGFCIQDMNGYFKKDDLPKLLESYRAAKFMEQL